jgi:hypothetical protein
MLSIKSFKESPEFGSCLSHIFDFPNQTTGLCGAKTRLIKRKSTAITATNIINTDILLILSSK